MLGIVLVIDVEVVEVYLPYGLFRNPQFRKPGQLNQINLISE
jgi:hypothetical protein